jgi:hypothetical protein
MTEYLKNKEVKKYKKYMLKLSIPTNQQTLLDSDDERRNNGIHTLESKELNIKIKKTLSPTIKHFERISYIF